MLSTTKGEATQSGRQSLAALDARSAAGRSLRRGCARYAQQALAARSVPYVRSLN